MTPNGVLLTKKHQWMVAPGSAETGPAYIATLARNLQPLGFTLSPALADRLRTLAIADLAHLYGQIVPILQQMVGANVRHRPMYPNFPSQVMKASDAELYLNALMHYYGDAIGARILPVYEKGARPPLRDDGTRLTVIGLGDEADLWSIFTQLAGSRVSLSESDREILTWFVREYGDAAVEHLPDQIPFKEHLCQLAALLIEHTHSAHRLAGLVKTATDVLRIAVSLSGGEVSLATPTRLKRWTRTERRLLLGYLDGCANLVEDMARYQEQWVVLLHGLHVGDYARRYPRACAAAQAVRGQEPIRTFSGRVETKITAGDFVGAADALRARPGEFARRLDRLFRESGTPNDIAGTFLDVADSVATPVLLQVQHHFAHRGTRPVRAVFPKGSLAKMRLIGARQDDLAPSFCSHFAALVRAVLVERFRALPPLGTCYIAPVLFDIVVPFAQRSASRQFHTLPRGSKLPITGEGNTLRFFIHWMDAEDRTRVDLDLSAMFLDAEFAQCGTVAYYNLREIGGHHSGDLTSAPPPDGASEFLDIDMRRLADRGVRYVAMCVNSYTRQPFRKVPACFAGWMLRQRPNSGEIFEPRTVANRFDLTAETAICVPALFDVVERRAIWVDLGLKRNPHFVNSVHGNRANLADIARVMSDLDRMRLGDLLAMHVEARGERVPRPAGANHVFDLEFAASIDAVVAQYL